MRRYIEDRKRTLIILGGAAAAILVVATSTSGDDPEPKSEGPQDVVETMSIAFEGYPSSEEIEPTLVLAMRATGTVDTAENRSRAGSALVAIRKKTGATEMDMLRCIPTVSGGAELPVLDFPDAAAICSLESL